MKKLLCALLCVMMVFCMMPTMAFAEETTVLEVGAGKTYATLNEAKDSDIAASAGGKVVYRIYGSVTLETLFSHGDWSLGTIEGATSDAKLTITGGGVTDIVNTTLRNLTFADNGEYLPTANEFMYQNFEACTFENVTFEGSPRLSGKCTVADCTFKNGTENKYGLWLDAGEFSITGSDFEIIDKAYGMVKSDASGSTLSLENNTFVNKSSSEKEALNTNGLVITAEGNTFTNFKGGILPTDKTNKVNGETATGADADSVIEAGNTVNPYAAAKIGETGYETLQSALDAASAAPGTYEIVLTSGTISENVVVDQKEGVNITIKGNQVDTVFTGKIEIDGNARFDGAETLTIDGVVFETTNNKHDFIVQNSAEGAVRYPHNVTVKNCSFTGPGADSSVVAMRIRQGYNIKVEKCTATNMHSLMQADSCSGITVDTVSVTESGRGMSLGTSVDVVIKGADINVSKYGVRLDGDADTSVTVVDSKVNAFIPIVVRNATAKYDLVFDGNNTMTENNDDEYWCVIGVEEQDYDTNGILPSVPAGNVKVYVNDSNLDKEGVYGAAPKVSSIGGGLLIDRMESDEEAGVYYEILNVPAKVTVRAELYAGDQYLTYKQITVGDEGADALGCTFYTVGNSNSWDQDTWTAYDHVVPTHAVLYFDGVEMGQDAVEFTAEQWAAFPGTKAASIGGGLLADRTATADNEAAVYYEILNVPANTEVLVELYAGEQKLTYKKFKTVGAYPELGCSFYTVGTSSSWEQDTWTAYDQVVPTHAVLYFNGVEMGQDAVEFTAEQWAAFPGTVAPTPTPPSGGGGYVPTPTPTPTPTPGEGGEVVAPEEEDALSVNVKALLDELTLVARSEKTAKNNIKVTLKLDDADKAIIKQLEDAGYTVKYNFYRSTVKNDEYKSMLIKDTTTYTNTMGVKGTMYYYKARVQVYNAEGELIARTALKDCWYANRLWTK